MFLYFFCTIFFLANASIKKRPQATWLETDLDLMITLEHGINIESDEQTKNNLYKNMINNTTSNNGCNLNVESRNVEDDEDSGSENKALGKRLIQNYFVIKYFMLYIYYGSIKLL